MEQRIWVLEQRLSTVSLNWNNEAKDKGLERRLSTVSLNWTEGVSTV
jgi:hypothetical protein